ncbi:nuclear transport factor 2 family protein [Actinoplanes sp. NPDC051494]|uniref:nuclear transport factor 2 family protein n=1 Tax=Actinoplanes sp. NPDC051494 TaxID=3363907 RepID=UPI0037AEDA97
MTITEQQVSDWVAGYVTAWRSTAPGDIAAIFAPGAESYEWPYETAWIGRDAIVRGWQSRAAWQEGGWSFAWELLAINGDTFAVKGIGTYRELGTFDNLWVGTLDDEGRCTVLRMWNNEISGV